MFTGEPSGEMKAAEQAMATVMAQAWGGMPIFRPISTAMGATSTAVGVFERNRPMATVTRKSTASTPMGPTPANSPSSQSVTRVMAPVRSRASARGSMPAMMSTVCQSITR